MTPSTNETTPNAARDAAAVRESWTDAGAGAHYRGRRWADRGRRERDARRLARLVARVGVRPAVTTWLDVACGTGRLPEAWGTEAARYAGLDASPSMLGAHGLPARVVRASATAIPFPDTSFELVVACRLLHHLADPDDLRAVARELVRVSRAYVAVTFWDARALADRWNPKRGTNARDPRVARAPRELVDAFEGAELVALDHSFRFVSRQAYALFRVRGAAG